MPSLDDLNAALLKADANGDTQNAQLFASQIKTLRGAGASAPAASPQDVAFAAGQQAGSEEGATMAGIGQAAQQGTMGLQNYINAGMRYAGQRAIGVDKPDDFATDLAYSRGKSQGEIAAHPYAGTVGGVAGAIAGGGALGTAIKGTRFARAISAVPGQSVTNVAKAAATGATVGGTTALAQGQSLPQAAQTAAISAVGAPVVGKVLSYSLSKLAPAAQQAMQTLAASIGEKPAVLQAAYDSYMKLTGRTPNMAELVGLQSQGKLRDLASANPTIAGAAMKAASIGNAPLHEQIAASQNANFPQSSSGILELRDSDMDQAMQLPHPHTGVALKDTVVSDPNAVLAMPHVDYALRPNTQLNARVGNVSQTGLTPLQERIQNNQATIGDVETVRKALRDQQNSLMRPAPGSPNAKDPLMANEFGDVANKVEGLGVSADPDYGKVLANYRAGSRYADGFSHGFNGKSYNDPGDDSQLASALKTPTGIAGYEHGNALYTGRQALESIAPGSVRQADGAVGARHLAQGAAALSTGGLNTVIHGLRALPVIGDRVPEKVQSIIAKQLFDPATTQQGIKNLTRAGVQAKDIRALAAVIGGVTAQRMADYISQQGQ